MKVRCFPYNFLNLYAQSSDPGHISPYFYYSGFSGTAATNVNSMHVPVLRLMIDGDDWPTYLSDGGLNDLAMLDKTDSAYTGAHVRDLQKLTKLFLGQTFCLLLLRG